MLVAALVRHHDRRELAIGAQERHEQAVHGRAVLGGEEPRALPAPEQLEIAGGRLEELPQVEIDLAHRLLQDHAGERLGGLR